MRWIWSTDRSGGVKDERMNKRDRRASAARSLVTCPACKKSVSRSKNNPSKPSGHLVSAGRPCVGGEPIVSRSSEPAGQSERVKKGSGAGGPADKTSSPDVLYRCKGCRKVTTLDRRSGRIARHLKNGPGTRLYCVYSGFCVSSEEVEDAIVTQPTLTGKAAKRASAGLGRLPQEDYTSEYGHHGGATIVPGGSPSLGHQR